jgi:hypothetical protein
MELEKILKIFPVKEETQITGMTNILGLVHFKFFKHNFSESG